MTGFDTRKDRRLPDTELEAIRWLAELQADGVTAEERRRFQDWLANPAHEAAYRQVQDF